MKNQKIRLLLFLLCSIMIFLFSCNGNIPNNNNNNNNNNETEQGKSTESEEKSDVSPLDPKYAHIRFGKTKDILLLDVEWHTEESYRAENEDIIIAEYGELPEWYIEFTEKIKNEEIYVSKTINGKSTEELQFSITSDNLYNNLWGWDEKDTAQIDPDGYYIFHIYPFYYGVDYYDENGERHEKYFFNDDDLSIYSEKEFSIIAEERSLYCDELLSESKITREEYNKFNIKSPLDYYVRVIGLFGEDDLKDYLHDNNSISPAPDLITGKDNFSVLFVGNSFIYTGDVPKQLSEISEMYGITLTYDSIVPGGAKLRDTMDKAIEKMQNKRYDYVIFQDYGGRQFSERLDFVSEVEILCDEARKSGAIPVLYNPAWANIDSKKPDKEMQAWFTPPYERAAIVNGAILVNAAEAWVYAYDKHSDLSLYLKGDYHANNAGAYLTACVFASTLFNLHVKDIAEDNLYHGDDAIRLGQAAWEYVSYYNEYKKSPTEIITVSDGLNQQVKK